MHLALCKAPLPHSVFHVGLHGLQNIYKMLNMTMEQLIVVHFLDIAKFLILYVIYAPIELHRVYYMLSITNDCVTWGKGVVPFLPYFGASAIFAIARCELVLKGRIRPTS